MKNFNKQFLIKIGIAVISIISLLCVGIFILSGNDNSGKKTKISDSAQTEIDISKSSIHNPTFTPYAIMQTHNETETQPEETTSLSSEQASTSKTEETKASTEAVQNTQIIENTTTQSETTAKEQTAAPVASSAVTSPSVVSSSTAPSTETTEAKIERILSGLTLEEKVYQMFIITPEQLTGSGRVTQAGDATKNAIWKYPVGGLIYFSGNIVNESQITSMLSNTQRYSQERCGLKMFLCIDEEGGRVARIGNNSSFPVTKFPDMAYISDESEAYHVGETIGTYLSKYGFNVDFAPDADVITEERNTVIGTRSFGTDPLVVSRMAASVARGLNSKGIMATYKHFPGHGATVGDTHEGFAYTEKTEDELMQSELIPFSDAAKNGSANMIMVAHISVPNITGDKTPSSLSYKVVTGILKEKLGYRGLIVTDALNMGAIVSNYSSGDSAILAVKSGNDLLLMPNDFGEASQAVIRAVRNGEISEERINESVRKIIWAKLNL